MKRLGHNKTVILITAGLLLLVALFVYSLQGEAVAYRATISKEVQVEETWKLPADLAEVSGISFFEKDKIAGVQDEKGVIYIYNLSTSSIEKEVEFAGAGDFEGIAIKDNVAYVLEANGKIHIVEDFMSTPRVKVVQTFFNVDNDMEGLFYDKSQNRLLLAPKLLDPNSKDQKAIYAAPLPSLDVAKTPVISLSFEEELFNEIREEERGKTFFPSEIAIDPSTKDILVLEAREPRLLILDPSGKPKALYKLDKSVFPQPEGITFDGSGNLYISSEGKPGRIHLVSITPN